jgi:hypothetical protein
LLLRILIEDLSLHNRAVFDDNSWLHYRLN